MSLADPAALLVLLLAAQGAMGGFDTLYNHELVERLARRPAARTELGLHAIREAIFAVLFAGLAWREWHGAWALAIAALLAAEIVNTGCDEFVENRTRVLPQNERVLHVLLILNLGAIAAVCATVLPRWWSEPTALVPSSQGLLSWLLSAFAVASAAWSLRDLVAFRRFTLAR